MVQFTSSQTSISKTTRNTHAYRDGTSDERRFYGLFKTPMQQNKYFSS
jgi:hypothetical protein